MFEIMPAWTLHQVLESNDLVQFVNDFTASVQGKDVEPGQSHQNYVPNTTLAK